jgi:hypothetical protein
VERGSVADVHLDATWFEEAYLKLFKKDGE